MHKACQLFDVAIIDNTSSFVAPLGAPRIALYRDPFHPSVQGTAKLAVSMKKMLANWQWLATQPLLAFRPRKI
ncbi:hypothetical protein ACOMHN_007744 [Nucella lapillus]